MTRHSTVFSLLIAFIAIVPLIVIANEDVLNARQEKKIIAAHYEENSMPLAARTSEALFKNHPGILIGAGGVVLLIAGAAVKFMRTQKRPSSLT